MLSRTFAFASLFFALTACGARDEGPTDIASIPFEDNKPPAPGPDVDPVECTPGAMYTCDCGGGNLGNKFCAWSGDAFSGCMLCGDGADYLEDTGIACDESPPPGVEPTPCPSMPLACTGLVCYSKSCWVTTALPRTELPDISPNNCHTMVCDGDGNTVEVPDPSDCDQPCSFAGQCVP